MDQALLGGRAAVKAARVLVTGSLAFDHIMDFPGRFSDHILPDRIHILNISFLVNSLKKQWGGTAGNIAYNLALLGEHPLILATAGRDFTAYKDHLLKTGVDVSAVKQYKDDFTSMFFGVTDRDDNQISGFYLGVMKKARLLSVKDLKEKIRLAIISPDDPKAMVKYTGECRETGIPFIFDPGQQIPRLSSSEIKECIRGCVVLIGNDYELELVKRKTGLGQRDLLKQARTVVITKAHQGSEIITQRSKLVIPPVKTGKAVDPTGAGDAYRAGLIKGILNNWGWEKSGRVASLAAVYAVEKYGTQAHRYSPAHFRERYESNFGSF